MTVDNGSGGIYSERLWDCVADEVLVVFVLVLVCSEHLLLGDLVCFGLLSELFVELVWLELRVETQTVVDID